MKLLQISSSLIICGFMLTPLYSPVLSSLIVQYYLCFSSLLSLRVYFLKTSTQIKRIESVARSPLYSHISLSLLGLSTIRALKMENRVIQDYHYYQDQHAFAITSFYLSGDSQMIGFTIPLLLTRPFTLTFSYLIR